jgi:predicted enzyme related to lactoylglutathione lyase/c-di-GMP-binding flagellar brake protein YcgR
MTLRLHEIVIPVSDIDQAAAFYGQLLGIPGRKLSPDRHLFDCEGLILTCFKPDTNPALPEEPADSPASATAHSVCFVVQDLEAMFEQAKAAGCRSLDDQINVQPWGYRSFQGQDPFGNSFGFVDEPTNQKQAAERPSAGPEDRLAVGFPISLLSAATQKKIGALVYKIFENEVWLNLSAISTENFQEGETVQFQTLEGGKTYSGETQIIQISPDGQNMAIAVPESLNELQRRASLRLQMGIPISYALMGGEKEAEPTQGNTRDVSIGGLRFNSSVPLEVGNELQITLDLTPSLQVSAGIKVISAEQIESNGEVLTSVGSQFVKLELDDQIKVLQFLIDAEAEEAEKEATTTEEQQDTQPADQPLATPASAPEESAAKEHDLETSILRKKKRAQAKVQLKSLQDKLGAIGAPAGKKAPDPKQQS